MSVRVHTKPFTSPFSSISFFIKYSLNAGPPQGREGEEKGEQKEPCRRVREGTRAAREEEEIPGESWPRTHRMLEGCVALFSYRNSCFSENSGAEPRTEYKTDARSS